MLMSRITRSGDSASKRWQRGRAIAGLDHQVARLRQREGDQVEQVEIVIGDQDLHAGVLHRQRQGEARAAVGGALDADAAAVALDDRPRRSTAPARAPPAPAPARRRAGSVRRCASLSPSGRPRALILDPGAAPVRPRPRAPTRTALPSGANLLALASRLTNTCVRRVRVALQRQVLGHVHARAAGGAGAAARRPAPRASSTTSRELDALAADVELAGLDAHALEQVVDEPREAQRAALQRQHQLLAAAPAAWSSSPSRSSSMEASCAASGVRNSCEMLASTESRARRTPRARSRRGSPAPAGRRPCARW